MVGSTASTNFPHANAPYSSNAGGTDAFAALLNPAGTTLVYSTYLGGSGDDVANGVALDLRGDAFIVGSTDSTNFPTTTGAAHGSNAGGYDAFLTELLPVPAAPVFTATSPDTGSSSSDQITSSQNLYLYGTAEPGAAVSLSRSDLGYLGSVTANALTGVWTFDYTGTTLPAGIYDLAAPLQTRARPDQRTVGGLLRHRLPGRPERQRDSSWHGEPGAGDRPQRQ